MMAQKSHFQVIWSDLTYTVWPKSTYADVWHDVKQRLSAATPSVSNLWKFMWSFSGSRASYDVSTKSIMNRAAKNSENAIRILRNVNGSFNSGELTAVLGPSGAGKTSLLNILSRRRDDGFTGRMSVTGTNHRVTINAIPQDDNLLECLTVKENLEFASRLKNPHPNQDHEKNVCKVSNLLGLDQCLDTRTGTISGGQQKRLAIAQELLSQPDILILDEPTSGLDSLTCLKTLSVLKDLVQASKKKMIDPIAIVFTIHQPQREAFELFDKVYVMANGGITVYDGPPSECTKFIETYSGLKVPDSDYNPASFLVEIASGEFGQAPIDALARQVRLDFQQRQEKLWTLKGGADKLKSFTGAISLSIDYKTPGAPVQVIERTRSTNDSDGISTVNLAHKLPVASRSATSKQKDPRLYLDPRLVKCSKIDTGNFCLKTKILTERCWKTLWREPKQVIARALFHLLLPFGVLFAMGTEPGHSNACPHFQNEYSLKRMMISDEYTSPSVQEEFLSSTENVTTLFVSIYSCIAMNIAAMTLVLALDMRNCLKEYHNGWYSMSSYVLARIISNIPIDLTLPTATIGLTYFVTEQETGAGSELSDVYRIIITALAIIIGSMFGQIVGMMFGAIYAGNITTAMFAAQGVTLPLVLLSGFLSRIKNMSKFVRALSFISSYRHFMDITYIARYGFNVCGCKPQDVANRTVVLTGVSDDLRDFIKNWMNSQDEGEADTTTAAAINPNDTGLAKETGDADADVFQMVAKQLSLYNTYGIEVESCADVKSHQLYDFGLSESDLPASFAALITLMISSLLILLLIVKLVVSYRTSL